MERTLYIDILIVTNFLIDYILLRATVIISGAEHKKWRLLAGAAVSSATSLVILLPQITGVLLFLLKLVFAGGIVFVAFGFSGAWGFVKNLLAFMFVSFVFGGAAYSFAGLSDANVTVNNMTFYYESTPLYLLCLIVSLYLIIRAFLLFWRSRLPQSATVKLRLVLDGAEHLLCAFVDTGNMLRDEISNRPVLLLGEQTAGRVLSREKKETMNAFYERRLGDIGSVAIRLIAYKSVGGEGLLVAFQGEKLEIKYRGKLISLDRPLVAVGKNITHEAVIGFDVLKNG